MLTSHITQGKLVHIKTLGSADEKKAPPLEFTGILKQESNQHFKGSGCIQIVSDGMIAVQNDEGKVIGFEKGVKVQTIPRRNVKSIDVVSASY